MKDLSEKLHIEQLLEKFPAVINKLILVPHAILNCILLSCLWDSKVSLYFFEKYKIKFLPNTQFLIQSNKISNNPRIALIGTSDVVTILK